MNCPIKLVVDLIPRGAKNRPGYQNPHTYITIHDTGNSGVGANAKAHASYVKGTAAANAKTSWHFTVDDEGAYQHLPLSETAFHAGDGNGAGNRKSIGIEICMNSDGNRAKAEQNAAKLTAWLMHTYSIPLENVKQHFNWSGKNCPQVIRSRPNGWDEFLNKVKEANPMAEVTSVNDIVWELADARGIISDKELWLKKLEEDQAAYWLARKALQYMRQHKA